MPNLRYSDSQQIKISLFIQNLDVYLSTETLSAHPKQGPKNVLAAMSHWLSKFLPEKWWAAGTAGQHSAAQAPEMLPPTFRGHRWCLGTRTIKQTLTSQSFLAILFGHIQALHPWLHRWFRSVTVIDFGLSDLFSVSLTMGSYPQTRWPKSLRIRIESHSSWQPPWVWYRVFGDFL